MNLETQLADALEFEHIAAECQIPRDNARRFLALLFNLPALQVLRLCRAAARSAR